jgi:hypothetical protein
MRRTSHASGQLPPREAPEALHEIPLVSGSPARERARETRPRRPAGSTAFQRARITRAPSYSAPFLRRNTISPTNRIASTAQTMRIIELSIVFLLSHENNFRYAAYCSSHVIRHMLFIIGISSRMIFMTTGPTVTTNKDGKIQKKIGNTSLTPSLAAFSSAICRA